MGAWVSWVPGSSGASWVAGETGAGVFRGPRGCLGCRVKRVPGSLGVGESVVETERLIVRRPVEEDRSRFVELFTDPSFTVFSQGVHDAAGANERFDDMLGLAESVPYAKGPIVEKSSGTILGYTGAGTVVFEGVDRLEWGWRLMPEARGFGYATEATAAWLTAAGDHSDGDMLCIIATDNQPSRRVAEKVGFRWWRQFDWDDDPSDRTDLLLRSIGAGGPPLLTPDKS